MFEHPEQFCQHPFQPAKNVGVCHLFIPSFASRRRVQIGPLHLTDTLGLEAEGSSCALTATQTLALRQACKLLPPTSEE